MTVAGGALSLAGASAAGWVAATHLPNLLDVVLQSEAAPSARTVTLVGLGTAAEEAPTEQLAAVDPAAVAASATRSATAPKPAAAPKSAAPQPAAATSAAPPPPSAAPTTAAPTPSTPTQRPASEDQDADENDSDESSSDDRSTEDDRDQQSSDRKDDNQNDDNQNDENRSGDNRQDDATSSSDSDDSGSNSDSGSGSASAGDGRSSTSGTSGATGVDSRSAPGLPTNTTGPVAGDLPSELIDTKDWYLTLPTGKQGDPDIVEGSALARYHSQFFQLNPAKDGVVFTAGTGGATTSGSQYPRSELREMFGAEKASWDGRKGRHTMEIVEAITETPKEKPDVIAGQIHGTSDDLMQIHLSGQQLRVKYADGQKYVDLDPNYRLGTMFAVKIESSGGRVKVWYNGQQKADLPISSSTSYFKAGVYTNSNPSTGDRSGEGQVVIRSLAVRHE
jgi:hypothetical protein